jgi:isopentenyl-diphosphate delta-isomerase
VLTKKNTQQLILVDTLDREVGTMDKMEVHRQGLLHRAFSIFIFNSNGDMLLQQRAENKYHSAGLWSNACCSHPFPAEKTEDAAHRRLFEEMGFDADLKLIFNFTYRAEFGNGLIEHEYDHVYLGTYDGPVSLNELEAMNYTFISLENIRQGLLKEAGIYTAWFKIAFAKLEVYLAGTPSEYEA